MSETADPIPTWDEMLERCDRAIARLDEFLAQNRARLDELRELAGEPEATA